MNESCIALRRVWLGLVLAIVTTFYGFMSGAVLGLEDRPIGDAPSQRVPEASGAMTGPRDHSGLDVVVVRGGMAREGVAGAGGGVGR